MSPEATCPRCGEKKLFHEDELEGAHAGEIVCMDCALEQGFNEFLGEVLAGEHKEMIKELEKRYLEDDDEDDE